MLDHTFAAHPANLALDEALLASPDTPETLRFWRPQTPVVVAGRSTRIDDEIDRKACERAGVPVLRRASGGLTIVTGQGCLMYAVVLDAHTTPEAADIDVAHRYVLGRMVAALRPLVPTVAHAGTSDLAIANGDTLRKFSGNSVRKVRSRLLYHGTLMHDFDLALIETLLRTPPRQPEYRGGRSHTDFVANLPIGEEAIATAIASEWRATPAKPSEFLLAETDRLATDKYDSDAWTFSR
ncbi:MAG: lipoate--protein ligase family protein [Planctomycetota bacterium]